MTAAAMRIVTLPGVFAPISDTWLLARALRAEIGAGRSSVLDVCTGSGALAVCAARAGASDVTALDMSRRAVLTARINARLNAVRLRALRSDLFSAVDGKQFDVIVSNPPYVPSANDELPTRGPERAWDAGRDGRAVLDRLGSCWSCTPRSAALTPRVRRWSAAGCGWTSRSATAARWAR
jgi:release factor glutamine methyltransferase